MNINESETGYYITEKQKQELSKKTKQCSLDECREIANMLLEHFCVFGKTPYDSNYGDDKKCKCGHSYYRHFDSYDNMFPIGCKYCECHAFEE